MRTRKIFSRYDAIKLSIIRRVVRIVLDTNAPGNKITSSTKKLLSDTYTYNFVDKLVELLKQEPLSYATLKRMVDRAFYYTTKEEKEENEDFASLVADAQAILVDHAQAILNKQKQAESTPNALSTNSSNEDNSATSTGRTVVAKEGGESERE